MTKIRKGDQVIEIDCDGEKCGECSKLNGPKCDVFNVLIDHVVCGDLNHSYNKRHPECIKAEVK